MISWTVPFTACEIYDRQHACTDGNRWITCGRIAGGATHTAGMSTHRTSRGDEQKSRPASVEVNLTLKCRLQDRVHVHTHLLQYAGTRAAVRCGAGHGERVNLRQYPLFAEDEDVQTLHKSLAASASEQSAAFRQLTRTLFHTLDPLEAGDCWGLSSHGPDATASVLSATALQHAAAACSYKVILTMSNATTHAKLATAHKVARCAVVSRPCCIAHRRDGGIVFIIHHLRGASHAGALQNTHQCWDCCL